MSTWPLLTRKKIEDSQIETPVRSLGEDEDEKVKGLAEKVQESFSSTFERLTKFMQLLAQWATLEAGYRIPKRLKPVSASFSF